MEAIYRHVDENSAYLVEDYPYGFRMRCRMKCWLEFSPKKGFRYVTVTENPKTGRWNAPKKGTYQKVGGAMYLNEEGHVSCDLLCEYDGFERVGEFLEKFPGANLENIIPYAKGKIELYSKLATGKCYMTINGVKQEPTRESWKSYENEIEGWKKVVEKITNILTLRTKRL